MYQWTFLPSIIIPKGNFKSIINNSKEVPDVDLDKLVPATVPSTQTKRHHILTQAEP